MAVLGDGEIADHHAGIVSRSTGVGLTADPVFQVGSITKLWTSMLVLQLVDEGHVLEELTDTRLPLLPVPPSDPRRIDASRYVGLYSCDVAELTVSQEEDGRVWLAEEPKGISLELGDLPKRTELVHYRDDTLIALEPERGMHRLHAFLGDDGTGHSLYAHVGRAIRRAGA